MFDSRLSTILERIHHSLFQSHFSEMRVREGALQYFEDPDAEILCSGHFFAEIFHRVQVLKVIAGEDFPFDAGVEIDEVADHAGGEVDRAADGDFEGIVVSVSVRVVALAVGGEVLSRGHFRAVEAMRGGEAIAAGEVSDHGIFDC